MNQLWRKTCTMGHKIRAHIRQSPAIETLMVLGQRLIKEDIPVTAGSLTFTTLMAIVPFLALALSVFTFFPLFDTLQDSLEQWMLQNLIPDAIADTVVSSVWQFAEHAQQLGTIGVGVFLLAAISLMSSINRHLNAIWQVRKSRPAWQLLIIYIATIALAPVLFGASITLTSFFLSMSEGWISSTLFDASGAAKFAFGVIEFLLLGSSFAALYHFIPNTKVRWRDAYAGGFFTAMGLGLAQKLLGLYLLVVPSYSVVYGAFATVPILLLWIYVSWIIILLGAVVTAYLPSVIYGAKRHNVIASWRAQQAIEALRLLQQVQQNQPQEGLTLYQMAAYLKMDLPPLEGVLESLQTIGWVQHSRVHEAQWQLAVQPKNTLMHEFITTWAFPDSESLRVLWHRPLKNVTLADVLDQR